VDALGRAAAFGNPVHLHLVHAAAVGEQQEVLVVAGGDEILHAVVIGRMHAGNALASPPLLLVGGKGGALDIAPAGQGNDHVFVRDQIFDVNACQFVAQDFRAPLAGVGRADGLDFFAHDAAQDGRVFQDCGQALNLGQEFALFFFQLAALKPGQALQAHVENGLGLDFGQEEAFREPVLGLGRRVRSPDEGHDLVNMIERLEQTFHDMRPGPGFRQLKAGAADDHLAPVIQKIRQGAFQIEQHRPVVGDSQHVDAETCFQGRELVQGVDDDIGNHPALEFAHDPDALAIRFVAQIRHAVDLVIVDESRNLFHQA